MNTIRYCIAFSPMMYKKIKSAAKKQSITIAAYIKEAVNQKNGKGELNMQSYYEISSMMVDDLVEKRKALLYRLEEAERQKGRI